jgi:hypothetical protein
MFFLPSREEAILENERKKSAQLFLLVLEAFCFSIVGAVLG